MFSALFKLNLQMALAYRADTVVNILLNVMWLGWELLGLQIIFSNTTTLGGWGFGELLALLGVFRLVNTLMASLIWPNTEKFNASIRDGSLDYTLLQPVNSMFLVTFSRMVIWRVWDLVLAADLDHRRGQPEQRRVNAFSTVQLHSPGRLRYDDHLQPVDRAHRGDLLVCQV